MTEAERQVIVRLEAAIEAQKQANQAKMALLALLTIKKQEIKR